MSTDSDPLLRAVADEDPACPDGRVLVALGRLIRGNSKPVRSVDLSADVLGRLQSLAGDDADHVDACYDRGEGAAGPLARLGELTRAAAMPPRPIDLAPLVLRRIAHDREHNDVAAALDGRSRWRIWSAVVAGHLAAVLAFAFFQVGGFGAGGNAPTGAPGDHAVGQGTLPGASDAASGAPDGNGPTDRFLSGGAAGDAGTGPAKGTGDRTLPLPTRLPAMWSDIRSLGGDIFLLRRFPELRLAARRAYGMEDSAQAVADGLAWLQTRQDADTGFFGRPTGDSDRDLASQSLAVLALLGEGFGDRVRTAAARRGLEWLGGELAIRNAPPSAAVSAADGTAPPAPIAAANPITAGLACLALVEGGLLLGDSDLRNQAEQAMAAMDRGEPLQPGASGLGGFTLLALETAQQGGLYVPGRLLQQARRTLGRSLPAQDDDQGRLGLSAFARFIYGRRGDTATIHQVEHLDQQLPTRDENGRADPLSWFFATLAMREAGGEAWKPWAAALQANLLPGFTGEGAKRHVDPRHVRHLDQGSEVFATAVTLLNLQAPYRYLPLAR